MADLLRWTAARGAAVRAGERGEALFSVVPLVWSPPWDRVPPWLYGLVERWPADLDPGALPAPGPWAREVVAPREDGGPRYPDCRVAFTDAAAPDCAVRLARLTPGDVSEAVAFGRRAMLEEWLLWRPEASFLWDQLGHATDWSGHRAWSARAFEVAAGLEEAKPDRARQDYGRALGMLGRHEEAVAELRRSLELNDDLRDGDVQWATLRLADNLLDAGWPEEALAALDRMRRTALGTRGSYWRPRHDALIALAREAEAAEARELFWAQLPDRDR